MYVILLFSENKKNLVFQAKDIVGRKFPSFFGVPVQLGKSDPLFLQSLQSRTSYIDSTIILPYMYIQTSHIFCVTTLLLSVDSNAIV